MSIALTNVLDVAIVLAGLYIGLSSICSYCNEQIAVFLQLRGRKLVLGVANLVFSRTLANAIFAHAMIDPSVNDMSGIRRSPEDPNRPPYVDPHNFAIAFWDELANATAGIVPPATRAAASVSAAQASAVRSPAAGTARLQAATELVAMRAAATNGGTGLLSSAAHFEDLRQVVECLPVGQLKTDALALLALATDYDSLLSVTEAWFNRQMDRVSGWYKRQAQYILIALAVFIVFVTGLDSLEIAQRLYTTPALLSAAASQISGAYPSPAPTSTSQSSDQAALAKAALGVFKADEFQQFLHPGFGIFGFPPSGIVQARNQAALDIGTTADTAAKSQLSEDLAAVSKADSDLRAALAKESAAKAALATAIKANAETSALDEAVRSAEGATKNDLVESRAAVAAATSDAAAAQTAADALVAAQAQTDRYAVNSSHLLGCLITIVAVSLGGPFWFDLLGKLINVRATGPKPVPKPS